ncbi:hypothetical protein KIPB_008756, partial [Kipferlia bialata]|eukprot:g8756.t1
MGEAFIQDTWYLPAINAYVEKALFFPAVALYGVCVAIGILILTDK